MHFCCTDPTQESALWGSPNPTVCLMTSYVNSQNKIIIFPSLNEYELQYFLFPISGAFYQDY